MKKDQATVGALRLTFLHKHAVLIQDLASGQSRIVLPNDFLSRMCIRLSPADATSIVEVEGKDPVQTPVVEDKAVSSLWLEYGRSFCACIGHNLTQVQREEAVTRVTQFIAISVATSDRLDSITHWSHAISSVAKTVVFTCLALGAVTITYQIATYKGPGFTALYESPTALTDYTLTALDAKNTAIIGRTVGIAAHNGANGSIPLTILSTLTSSDCPACIELSRQAIALPPSAYSVRFLPMELDQDKDAAHRAGLAFCAKDGGSTWMRLLTQNPKAPIGPIDAQCAWKDRAKVSTLFVRTFAQRPAMWPAAVAGDGAVHYGPFKNSAQLREWAKRHGQSNGAALARDTGVAK